MKVNLHIISVFLLLLISMGKVSAQSDYSPKTNVIYYFTKYLKWPENTSTGNFVIGVYKDDLIYEELKKGITGRRVGNQRIVISKINDIDPENLHVSILYIGTERLKEIQKLIDITQHEPVLIITQTSGTTLKGVCMNMTVIDDKVKLEIDKSITEARGIKIASELLAFQKTNH